MTDERERIPAPLLPGDVDLRNFPFMPLDVNRLRDSEFIASRSADEVVAGILLWSASWHQQPASSLPDDDIQLARLAGYGRGVKEFKRVREGAMHRLVRCSDGRWYHPVVAEKAAEAWNKKLVDEWRRAADRVRKENKERAEAKQELLLLPPRPTLLVQRNQGVIPTWRYQSSGGIPTERNGGDGGIPDLKDRDREKDREKDRDGVPPPSASEHPKAKPSAPGPAKKPRGDGATKAEPLSRATWNAYATAYLDRYGTEPVRNETVNGQLVNFVRRIGIEESPGVAAFYVRHNARRYVEKKHSVGLMLHDCEGLRTEWAMGRTVTETQARQQDRTATTGAVFRELIEEARNGTHS